MSKKNDGWTREKTVDGEHIALLELPGATVRRWQTDGRADVTGASCDLADETGPWTLTAPFDEDAAVPLLYVALAMLGYDRRLAPALIESAPTKKKP